MNLNQLYYFNELAEQHQFSKAAKNLYISQPSLSNSIKALENELGCKLINRSGGQITLTEYGEIFYQATSSSVNTIDLAKRKIDQHKRKNKNIIKISSIPSALSDFLPPIIHQFKNEIAPNSIFIYQSGLSNRIYQELDLGTTDIGICSKIDKHSNLSFLPLYNEKIIVITAPSHPLANKKIIQPHDLLNYNLITYSDKTSLGKKIRKTLLRKEHNLRISSTKNDEISIATEVLSNNSVGVCVNNVFLKDFEITKTKLNISTDTRTVYLAYNPRIEPSDLAKELIAFMTIDD